MRSIAGSSNTIEARLGIWQAHRAGTGLAPVHRQRRRSAAIRKRGRPSEFGDQQFRIVDLGYDQYLAELGRDREAVRDLLRRLRVERHARAIASQFEPERKARYGSVGTIIGPARFRLLRAPGVGCDARLRRRIEPERAPPRRREQEQDGQEKKAPKRAPARREADIGHAATFDQ